MNEQLPSIFDKYLWEGMTLEQFANLMEDRALLARAAGIVDRILAADPKLSEPEHAPARAAVERWRRNAAVREDAG